MKHITVLGAGLAGALMAIYLAKRGYHVDVFESRDDIRLNDKDKGRSINMAMSCRGITGLTEAGLFSAVKPLMVPMRARAIHNEKGEVKYQPFGRSPDEHINAIQRCDLNKLLLDTLQSYPNVRLAFNMKTLALDWHKKVVHFEEKNGNHLSVPWHRLIGADGAGSFVRESLVDEHILTASRVFLPVGYKELSISGKSPQSLVREHLHLWPRETSLLLGNPNLDHSITGSLFLPHEGPESFATLTTPKRINSFFQHTFSDAITSMPDLVEEFLHHPTGTMSTIKCSSSHYGDQCLLIGDASHGIVPFFGQGMNAAFEDCRILNAMLDEFDDDWAKVMPLFSQVRKPDTDAVAKMSLDNYHEIQIAIRCPEFNLKKQLNQLLMQHYPERYVSRHVLVMFTNMPYSQALAYGTIQDNLLSEWCTKLTSIDEIDWNVADQLMKEYDKNLTELISFKNTP